ncbi:energy transducer TonB [Oricola sp.]|uniref:energy transducer TonB n=1 Tax=Oricola sp. TaxID=1979950 RepID=UPI0025D457CE|nr:energy transducer TonB [Oricola sp.]MCI5074042.1 energy transducer TonB [Oricola sp.]
MRAYADILPPEALSRFSWSRVGLWSLAAVMILSAHVGTAIWSMRTPTAETVQEAAPAAIMIEMAAEPAAPESDEEEIAPQETESAEAMAAQPVELAEQPEEEVEPDPDTLPDVVEEPEPEEIVEDPEPEKPEEIVETSRLETPEPEQAEEMTEEEPESLLEATNVPIPTPRPAYTPPKMVEKPKPKKKVAATPKTKNAASHASAKAKVKAKKAPVAAAKQTSRGAARTISPARWQSRLLAHLERRKRYPSGAKRRREQGVAYVRFTIDAAGNVKSARLARSSGFPELDREVVAMVRRASPVPAPPPGVGRTITVPVRFRLK